MKRKYWLLVLFAIMVILGSYLKYESNQKELYANKNYELFYNATSEIPNDYYESNFKDNYVLFMNTSSINPKEWSGLTYIGKVSGTMSEHQIRDVYVLDDTYRVLTFNQNTEQIILYGDNGTLKIGKEGVVKDETVYDEIMANAISRLSISGNNMDIQFVLQPGYADYPTLGYSHTINMLGTKNIIPISTTRNDARAIENGGMEIIS